MLAAHFQMQLQKSKLYNAHQNKGKKNKVLFQII
jgi:hypothetical protein